MCTCELCRSNFTWTGNGTYETGNGTYETYYGTTTVQRCGSTWRGDDHSCYRERGHSGACVCKCGASR